MIFCSLFLFVDSVRLAKLWVGEENRVICSKSLLSSILYSIHPSIDVVLLVDRPSIVSDAYLSEW